MKIKTGDEVLVIAGKDKGSKGTVLAVFEDRNKVIVEGVNMVTKHNRVGQTERGGKTGGIEKQESPIHISNVALVDPSTKKPSKVGFKITTSKDGETKKVRVAKTSGKEI